LVKIGWDFYPLKIFIPSALFSS